MRTDPEKPEYFYRHSIWMRGGSGWPWVAACGVKGLSIATLGGFKNGSYTVRLTFASPDDAKRRFDVVIQDKAALQNVQPAELTALTETVSNVIVSDGTMQVRLEAREGATLLCGLEIIRDGLAVGELPDITREASTPARTSTP